jgi:hypothetical protein
MGLDFLTPFALRSRGRMAEASRRAEVLRDASDCVFGSSARTGKGMALTREGATGPDGEDRFAQNLNRHPGLDPGSS